MMHQPTATLYIKNIDWKIKKGLLRRALYTLFARHGKVLEIIALRKDGLRGQAFVIMDDVQSATAALQAEQGFSFFGKDMIIEYAKHKSDRIAKRDGDYVPKSKRQKIASEPEKEKLVEEREEMKDENDEKKLDGDVNKMDVGVDVPVPVPTAATAIAPTVISDSPPSQILLAQNLPVECNQMMLGMLFQQYSGYKEVRLPRAGLAFIEYEDEAHATIAMKALNGFKLTPKDTLQLSYGKV